MLLLDYALIKGMFLEMAEGLSVVWVDYHTRCCHIVVLRPVRELERMVAYLA